MTTAQPEKTRTATDNRTRVPLEEALLIVGFGKGFTYDDYLVKAQQNCSWEKLRALLSQCQAEAADDPEQQSLLNRLRHTSERQSFFRLLQKRLRAPHRSASFTKLLAEAEKQAIFASIDDRAWERICEAAYQSHLTLEGIGPLGPGVIPPLLFGPGAPGKTRASYPPGVDGAEEPPLAIVWERDGSVVLVWEGVEVDRARLDEWLQPATQQTAAVAALAAQLKYDPHLRRDDAFDWLIRHGHIVSGREFQFQLWPRARVEAGLSEKAPRGPKPKSLR